MHTFIGLFYVYIRLWRGAFHQLPVVGGAAAIPSQVVGAVPTSTTHPDLPDAFKLSDWVPKEDARTQSPLFIAYGLAAGTVALASW
jgi:hypothetical protein